MTTNIKKNITQLAKDEHGSSMVVFGLTILPAVMLIGGAIDFGNAYKTKQRIQVAADAGVLAAVAMGATATPAQREAMATSVFNANLNGVVATPVASATDTAVTLTASTSVETSFLKVMHIDNISMTGSAKGSVSYTSVSTDSGGVCMLALAPYAQYGFKSQGTPNVAMTDCWGHTNSTTTTAIDGGGSAVATGRGFSAVGAVTTAALPVYEPDPTGGKSAISDPFAKVSAYSDAPYESTFATPTIASTCTATNKSFKRGEYTMTPGRYCGGINIQAGAQVTFEAGEYIIDGGVLNVQSGGSLIGSNVLFYYTGAAARMQVIGGATVNLTGRQTGSSYAGFLFIAHPDASRDLDSRIQGGGSFKMEGMIYMPTQNIVITGNGDSNGTSNFFAIIARSFEFRGNGIFNLKNWNEASNMPDIMARKNTSTEVATVKIDAE